METERKSRENETAKSKQHDPTNYRPLLTQFMQASNSTSINRTLKGKKAKDAKQLRLNHLQEDLININDSKCILTEWNNSFKRMG